MQFVRHKATLGFYPALLACLEVGDVCGRIQRPCWVVNVGDAVGLFSKNMSILLILDVKFHLRNEEQNLLLHHVVCVEYCRVLQCNYGILEVYIPNQK